MAILSSDRVKMTSILEKAISVIAPFRCIACGNYNNVVCTACTHAMQRLEVPLCMVCGITRNAWAPCDTHNSPIIQWYAAATYDGLLKDAIHMFKFGHARAVAGPLANLLTSVLPHYGAEWHIVAIPTIAAHIRQRGYDHARLLGRELANQLRVPTLQVLRRIHDTRQVGANRKQRMNQMKHAFIAGNVAGKRILLVDDVCTTGATLTAAAQALRAAGAVDVHAAVVAYRP